MIMSCSYEPVTTSCRAFTAAQLRVFIAATKLGFSNSQITNMNRRPQNPTFPNRNRQYPKIPLPDIKSELCRLFQKGKCYYGQNCHYAHSPSEVRNPASTLQCAYFARGVDCPFGETCRFRHFRKTSLCWQWERFGGCPYGVKCYYAHGNEELRAMSGLPSHPDTTAEPSDVVGIKIAKKLRLKDRSYFTNWDVATIGRIYADN